MDSEKVVKDRLSSLPDSLILHILSFLPTDEAVRTMLISKSFSSLWTLLPSLDLCWLRYRCWKGNCKNYDSRFCEFLHYVLKYHKRPKIEMLRVFIGETFYPYIDMNLGSDLKSCVDFALRKQVKTLELTSYVNLVLFKWPSELISDSLAELSLESIDLNSITQVHLGKLRRLALSMVRIQDSVLGEIIRGCPLLKELKIHNCFPCYEVSELSFDAPNFEKLIVDFDEPPYEEDYNVGPSVKINCPNLKFLEFSGPAHSLEIVNLSSIVDVTLHLDCWLLDFIEIPKIISVLKTLLCAKNVSFSDKFVTISFYCMLKKASHLPTINWKSARFSFWLTKKSIHALNFMLRNTPHLEELVINITIRPENIPEPIEVQFEDDVLDKEDCWMCLQSVALHDLANTSYPVLVSFTELLLKKAPALNQLTFYYGRRTFQLSEYYLTIEMTKFAERTSKLAKAFPNVKISYVVG